MFNTIHADGCTTNLGVIGALCNCGAEAEQKNTLRQVTEWGNEWCPHDEWAGNNMKKRYCSECWAELGKESK